MKHRDIIFNNIVNYFVFTDQLGHYDEENYSICLYDQSDDKETVKFIKEAIEKQTKSYKLAFTGTSDGLYNIDIFDIGL